MDSVLTYLRAHATSLSSYAVVVLTLASTLLASAVIGPDTTAYHVLGYVAAVLTALGFKALPASPPPLVAVDPADPWLVMGFVLGRGAEVPDPPVLSYLHVRGGFRGLGLATALASLLGIRRGRPTLVEFPDLGPRPREPRDGPPDRPAAQPDWDLKLVEPRL